jgi:hypothetical protein
MARWNASLMCSVIRIEYYYDHYIGVLWMESGHCVDMTGAIKFFQAIDPKVRCIYTYSGMVSDTAYRLDGKKWNVYRSPELKKHA